MKKITLVVFMAALFSCTINNFYLFGSEPADSLLSDQEVQTNEVSQKLGEDFANNAMNEFKSLDATQVSYPEIKSRMQTYASAMASALFKSGLTVDTVELMMQKSSLYYAECVDAIFTGVNLNDSIQKYVAKISDLFSEQHLNIDLQSELVSLASNHLVELSPILNSYYR